MVTPLVLATLAIVLWPGRPAVSRLRVLTARAGIEAATPASVFTMMGSCPPVVLRALLLAGTAVAAALIVVAVGPLQCAAVTLLGFMMWWLHARARARQRQHQLVQAWEESLDRMASALHAGSAGSAVLANATPLVVSTQSPDTTDPDRVATKVTTILHTAYSVASLGGSAATSLHHCGDPVAAELGTVWLLAEQHGVPLRSVIQGFREDLSRQRSRAGHVDAALAGPRATAMILTALPAVGLLMGTGLGANPLSVLSGGLIGGVLSLGGAVFLATGLWWTEHIVTRAAH